MVAVFASRGTGAFHFVLGSTRVELENLRFSKYCSHLARDFRRCGFQPRKQLGRDRMSHLRTLRPHLFVNRSRHPEVPSETCRLVLLGRHDVFGGLHGVAGRERSGLVALEKGRGAASRRVANCHGASFRVCVALVRVGAQCNGPAPIFAKLHVSVVVEHGGGGGAGVASADAARRMAGLGGVVGPMGGRSVRGVFLRAVPGWALDDSVCMVCGVDHGLRRAFFEDALMTAPFLMFQHWQQDVAELWDTLLWKCTPWRLAAVALAGACVLPMWAACEAFGAK